MVAYSLPQLQKITPGALSLYDDAFECANTALIPFGILESKNRAAHFLAQVLHESGGLKRITENLNYTTAERIKKVWPTRFPTVASAAQYVRNPAALANKVYGGRIGNYLPNDGWTYRGRGALQLTFRDNYRRIGDALGVDLVNHPDRVLDPRLVLLVAGEIWRSAGCNGLADLDDLNKITLAINGGLNGLEDRRLWLIKARSVVTLP